MKVSQQVLEWQAEGAIQARREDLRLLLEDRFGTLPEALLQRIEATEDPERLRSALLQVHKIQSPDELQL